MTPEGAGDPARRSADAAANVEDALAFLRLQRRYQVASKRCRRRENDLSVPERRA
jgi:hypothetical protein